MNKKSQGISLLNVIIIAAIALIVLLVIVLIFTGRINLFKQYDEEKHYCEETCFEAYTRLIENTPLGGEPTESKYKFNCWFCNTFTCLKGFCYDWRDKDKCELNPEAEGCICDEKVYKKEDVMVYGALLYKTEDNNCTFEVKYHKDGRYYNGELLRNDTEDKDISYGTVECDTPLFCIKSHLPNECEKENPDYVLDCDKGGGCEINNGTLLTYWRDDVCNINNCPKKICRKKTIRDYPCKVLRKVILLQQSYCPRTNKFSNETTFCLWRGWMNGWMKNEQIYEIADNEMGCYD